ncbi:MAG: extracellular solute-binding protein [Lachnospiraceae bacterium]|nr:extracellular solute-binding protein [Lachnospiraceae bacterium]
MRSMKKLLALALTATMSATLLVGCGGDDAGTTSQGSGSATGTTAEAGGSSDAGSGETQDITLKVWCPQNQVDSGIMEEQQAAFAAEHPEYNITWTTEVVGEDKCSENVLKDVDAAADVFMFANDQTYAMVEAGALAQLGGEAESMVKDNMTEDVAKTVTYTDGGLYGIPFTHNTFVMFYDKTLLEEGDITSLEKIMAKETADNVYNYYFESAGGWKLGCYYYGAGLSVFGPDGSDLAAGVDWNSEKGVAVTNYLIDLINNKKCAYDGEIAVSELIAEHRLGAWFDGAWNYDMYKEALGDDLGIATIPTFNPDGTDYQLLGFYGSKAIGVNAHSQNMAAAVQFATFLGNEENQVLRFEKSAQVPTNKAAGEIDAVTSDALAKAIVEEANTASVAQPQNSVFSTRYWNYAGAIATEIRSGEITKDNVQEKLDSFVQSMTAE